MTDSPPAAALRKTPRGERLARPWVVVAGGFLALFFSAGIWHSFGVFFKPLLAEFGLARTSLSLVTSIAIVTIAATQLVVGRVIRRFGASRTIRAGMTLMGAGLLLSGFAPGVAAISITFSLVMAAGYGFSSLAAVGDAVAQWFDRRRGTAIGIAFAGFSAGELVLTPLIQLLILRFSWRAAFWILGAGLWVAVVLLLLPLLRDRPQQIAGVGEAEFPAPPGAGPEDLPACASHADRSEHVPPREALRTPAFWLLSATYFACGFTDFLLFFHFPIFAIGLGVPDQTAANILGAAGGVSIVGTVVFSAISDRAGRPVPLAVAYAVRAAGFLLLTWSRSIEPLYAFMGFYGFVLFASNPITSAATRELYGPRSFGTVYGYLIFVHYVGSFFGPLAGGMAYDRWGRYDEAFLAGAALLAGAAACALAIRGRSRIGGKAKVAPAGART